MLNMTASNNVEGRSGDDVEQTGAELRDGGMGRKTDERWKDRSTDGKTGERMDG